ncbi:PKD domain-containing protein [Pedobacter sp. SG918]|uniref:PKD domain-containing protein n=1 Tax=Pedobacter sp. SG918 TaxID=2587136 RepID=UPI00146C8F36|nr:PKD domain-containing protein [Pedobacter sp. SG918]NMN37296.1 gliding motility-associated-like protein [Pedobacter sp. SG918]
MNRHWLLVLLMSLFFTKTFGQNVSNEGTDFWAVFPTHVPSGGFNGNIAIFVTSKSSSEVTVTCGSATPITKTIPANTAVRFDVPRADAYIDRVTDANRVLTNRGIHIKVADGKPKVSVYAHIYGRARSAASLILPFETLGQTYYSMNFTQTNGGNNFLTLVAVEDNTKIILHEKNGNKIPITLSKAGDAYEYLASGTEDLTGIYVETDPETSSCKRFAAFSGSSVIGIVCNNSQDPLFQQLYPTNSWGKNYGVVPFINRKYILRILAQEDNTSVTYNGITQVINKGKFFIESGTLTGSTFITADKLISVAQYALSQDCSSANGGGIIGDPEMVILNPIEFNIRGVTVFSSNLEAIQDKYINVLIKTDKISGFRYNGVVPTTAWIPLSGNPLYSYTQITVDNESVTLTADDGFNAIAYGFGDHESYAYSAGTNLSSNNYVTVFNSTKNEEGQNGCVGETYNIKITLPYQPNQISWSLDNEATILQNAPILLETKNLPDGTSVYTYESPYTKSYTTKGKHSLDVITFLPNASSCISGEVATNYTFNIYDLPTAKFDPLVGCAGTDVKFTDLSVSNSDLTITKWLWDFGDESTPSTEQHPLHTYTKAGKYFARLTVSTEYNCSNTSELVEININPQPISDFDVSGLCTSKLIKIIEKSTIENPGTIVKWTWDFGDGSTPSTEQHPIHQYSATGSYTITLTTESDKGCVSVVKSKTVTVIDPQSADFELPGFCLADGVARFKNTSKNADGSTTGLTAQWTFTFNNAIVATSTDFDGSFTPTATGDYIAALIVKNGDGCEMSKTLTFTVNGDVKTADFEIINDHSCVSENIMIKNTSTVFTGKITKIEIYRDFGNESSIYKTIPYPDNNEVFILNYNTFGGTTDRTFNIRLVAYSGENCFKYSESQTLTLKPVPQLVFDDMAPVCDADGTVLITQAKQKVGEEMNGPPGVYSGDGMRADGTFNPKIAGLGPHTITYTFTGDNGCPNSISNTITVYKSPVADAGTLIYILAGGQIEIPATAEGTNLKYEWSPAVGLNKTNVLNPIASPNEDTEYTLTATTQPEGCVTTSKVLVKVLQAINPPNTFTPNGDNVNDTWIIKYLESYPNATVEIFNRNGNRVFFSNGYKIPFDGNYQNEPLPVGVYYYIINPRNGRKTITGPLTIIR